jgi:flagellar biosynthesis/type III secretory pathway protein FliH
MSDASEDRPVQRAGDPLAETTLLPAQRPREHESELRYLADEGADYDGPWSEERARPPGAAQEAPADEGGDDWGIPGLEIAVQGLRGSEETARLAAERQRLAHRRQEIVNLVLSEVLNRAKAVRTRIWLEYQRAVRRARPGDGEAAAALRQLADARRRRDRLFHKVMTQLVDWTLQLEAQHLALRAERRPNMLANLVQEALERALRSLAITVRVSPELLARLRSASPALLESYQDRQGLELREDAAVPAGACILETGAGFVPVRAADAESALRLLLADPAQS